MSSRIGFLFNSGCKLLTRCSRTAPQQNEKGLYRLVFNLNSDCSFVRNFSTLNCYKRTRENRPTSSIDLYKTRYVQIKDFSNQIDSKEDEYKKLPLFQKIKYLWKNYWYVTLPVHMVTSCFWFGGFYYLVASGIDTMQLLETLHCPDFLMETIKSNEGKMAGDFVAALALYKVATPARYFVTIGGTTVAINYLKNRGLIKPANKEQLTKLYSERKDALKGKMQVTKDELLLKKKEVKQQCKEAKEEFSRSMIRSSRDFNKFGSEVKDQLGYVKEVVKHEVDYLKKKVEIKNKN